MKKVCIVENDIKLTQEEKQTLMEMKREREEEEREKKAALADNSVDITWPLD